MTDETSAGELTPSALQQLVESSAPEDWLSAASDPTLSEGLALRLLHRPELTTEILQALARNPISASSRKVLNALARHAKTPRRITLRLIQRLWTFELMQFVLTLTVAADLRMHAEKLLVTRSAAISLGERISLARRASAGVVGALLLDSDARVVAAALNNSRLTEAAIMKALSRESAPQHLVLAIIQHEKWRARQDVRIALLRNPKTPLARALQIAESLPGPILDEMVACGALPAHLQQYLRKALKEQRRGRCGR